MNQQPRYSKSLRTFIREQVFVSTTNAGHSTRICSRLEAKCFSETHTAAPLTDQQLNEQLYIIHKSLNKPPQPPSTNRRNHLKANNGITPQNA